MLMHNAWAVATSAKVYSSCCTGLAMHGQGGVCSFAIPGEEFFPAAGCVAAKEDVWIQWCCFPAVCCAGTSWPQSLESWDRRRFWGAEQSWFLEQALVSPGLHWVHTSWLELSLLPLPYSRGIRGSCQP